MAELATRIIKSNNCKICKSYLERLDSQGFKYEIYDADDPKNQKQLDEWRVEKMPVVQIVEIKKDEVIVRYQFASGTYSPRMINYKKSQIKT